MPPPGSATSLPSVQFREFEGPLDLLLDEVRRQNVEIESIAMAPIVSRFLDYMVTAAEHNLNLDIDWLHMAATLIHWKSRRLLPSKPGESSESDPIRNSLVQLLLAHSKEAAEELGRCRAVEQTRVSRPAEGAFGEEGNVPDEPPVLSVWEMIQQAREVAVWVRQRRDQRRELQEFWVAPDDVTVSEMIEHLRTQLAAAHSDKTDGATLLKEQLTPSRRACLFLGILEMARNQELQVEQNEAFGPLWLSVR